MKIKYPALIALLLFSLNQLQNVVVTILVKFFGVFEFLATSYWNRIYAFFILATLLIAFRIPKKISTKALSVTIFFTGITFYGFFRNTKSEFIADFILLIIPFVFFKLFSIYLKESKEKCAEFIGVYYKLNVLILVPAIVFKFLNYQIFYVDFNFIACYLMTKILLRSIVNNKERFKVYRNFIMALIAGIGKVIIVQSLLFFVIRFLNLKRFLYFIPLAIFLFFSVILIDRYSENLAQHSSISGSLPRGVDLIKNTDYTELTTLFSSNIGLLVNNPEMIFTLTDPSTGERLFELFTAIATVNRSLVTQLFGLGLGGTLNLSDTHDGSIAGSHDDISKVRVVHLMLTFLITKFGYLLSLIIILFGIKYLINILSTLRRYEGDNVFLMLGCLGIFFYFIGGFFTLSLFIKDPMLAFYIYCYSIRNAPQFSIYHS